MNSQSHHGSQNIPKVVTIQRHTRPWAEASDTHTAITHPFSITCYSPNRPVACLNR